MATAPQSAYRSFVGVAKDTVNANLSATIASGATSLPVTNTVGTTGTLTTSGSTYSAVIVDGPLTETVACTGNLAAGAVPVAATANAHSANVYVYFQLTASIGPTAFLRVTKIDFSDAYAQLYDKGYRGSQAFEYGAQQGMRIANFALEGDLFADEFGYLLSDFFGAYDFVTSPTSVAVTAASNIGAVCVITATGTWVTGQTVTISGAAGGTWSVINGTYQINQGGSGTFQIVASATPTGSYTASSATVSGPTTYSFSPQNTGNGQPASYLLYDYNPGANQTYVMAKAVTSDLGMKFDPAALTQWTASGKAFAMGPVATPTPSFSAFTPVAARVGGTTIGGTITPDLATAEFTFKREEFGEVNTIQGLQDPLAIFSGPVSVNTKFTIVQADATQYLNYVNQTQPSFRVAAVKGGASATAANGVFINCSQANYADVKITQTGKAYVTLDGSFEALANTTDATTAGGGYSPARVTISTGTAGGSTQY